MATAKQKKAAVGRMKAAAEIMKSKTATKAEKASAKRKRDAANKIRTSKTTTEKTTSGGNIKDAPSDTAERRSPTTYRPNVPIAKKGTDTFHGTNIPTEGYSKADIRDYNARLKADLADKNYRGANDVIFDIAFAKGGGAGNPRVGAVQSGMYRLKGKDTPLWAEGQVNSTNDRYVLRNDQGEPTGEEVRFSDKHGVVRGAANEWKPIDSWGGNARAGIVEGQPTKTPGVATNKIVSIVDLDTPGGMVLAGPGAGNLLDYAGPAGGSGIGTAVGGLMATTPYTQQAPQDWSALRYTYAGSPQSELGQVTQTPASRAMFGDKGAAMQPWATGQQVPAGLLNYQIPGGAPVNVGYSNPLGLFDYNNQQDVTNQNNVVTNPLATNPSAWSNYDPKTGKTTTDFAAWQQAQHDALYPGRQAAANKAGVGGWKAFTPAGRAWTAAQPNTSAAWIAAQKGLLVDPNATAPMITNRPGVTVGSTPTINPILSGQIQ